MIAEYVSLAALLAFAIAAGWTDITRRSIANRLVFACLVAGLALAIWTGGIEALGWHVAHMAVALVIGMILFAIGAIGGGDGKYYAAVAAYFPLQQGLHLGVAIALAGGLLLVVWFAWRQATKARRTPGEEGHFARLPYGVAIGAGAVTLSALPLLG